METLATTIDQTDLFLGMPVPPSVNNCYMPLPNGGRCRNKLYKDFAKKFDDWAVINYQSVNRVKKMIKPWRKVGLVLTFSLPESKIYTKTGTIKKYDISNRIKVIEDAISNLICLDDSNFWEIKAIKTVGETEGVSGKFYNIEYMN
jgi:Holliday junction resolvase RusA-like endonuclease